MKKLRVIIAAILSACMLFDMTACGGTKVAYAEFALTGESYGFCVDPDNQSLLDSVNELLEEIKADGTLDALYAAEENGTATDIGTVQTTSTNRANELVVATNAEFAPFEYKMGNNFAGVDMQIAKLLAEKLDKTLVILDMKFESVIISVGNGSCDIGMAGLTISDGRSEGVTFSDPYYDTTQIIAFREGDTRFANCADAEAIIAAIKGLEAPRGGAATGQTGYFYLAGSEDFEFEGFSNVQIKQYDSIALAVKDLSNKNIDFVVGDKDTVKAAVAGVNG